MDVFIRNTTSSDTETLLLVLCLFLIAAARMTHNHKFQYFMLLFFSGKYLNRYGREQGFYYHWFHIFLGIAQFISFGLFLKIAAVYFKLNITMNITMIILCIAGFVALKFFIEKFIAFIFKAEVFFKYYNFQKMSYQSFIGMALLPFNALLIYHPANTSFLMAVTLIFFGLLSLISIVRILKKHKSFYFILYLCLFEIAPYFIVARSLNSI